MKRLIIILICISLLVGCKGSDNKDNTSNNNGSNNQQEVPVNVYTDNGGWTEIKASLSDSLNSEEVIGQYSISIPDWENERDTDYVLFKKDDIFLVLRYDDNNYTSEEITNYTKSSTKKTEINSYKAEYTEGNVSYNKEQRNYISYYINDNDITIKIIGISKEKQIKDLNEMIQNMIESLKKENN